MLFTNITLFMMMFNITGQYNTTGLVSIKYVENYTYHTSNNTTVGAWFFPYQHDKGKLIVYERYANDYMFEHELKHLYCWRKFHQLNTDHKGCFEK